MLGRIDEFKGYWRKLKEIRAERLSELRKVTTIESTGSSTRIEGAELSDAEVAKVLEGISLDSFRARDESEVRGYAELLQTIFDNHGELPLRERFIKQLHGILLKYSEADAWHRGEYKKTPNHVEAKHPDGRVEVVFQTAAPFDTPQMMQDLVEATNTAIAAGESHPVVVIARFIVDFLAIHPFQDGNGRLARALTTLLLLQSEYEYMPYASLERIIEENKAAYYAALRASQLAMRADPQEFGEWLLFLLARLDVERSMLQLSSVQEGILVLLDQHGKVSAAFLSETLGIPDRTIRYHLDILIHRGLVATQGERRGRRYVRGSTQASGIASQESKTAALLAEILEAGGRINKTGLGRLVKRHGYDARTVGTLHGRRMALLRRDARTGQSVLTARGRELAQQYLFAKRLSDG
ncbi:MAG: Fic family protein [Gemmatimonadota bacterium]